MQERIPTYRAEQPGVAGLSIRSDTIDWRCELCDTHVRQPRLDAQLPAGWMHVTCARPPVARNSLLCPACAISTPIMWLADKQTRDHEAWLESERKWIAQMLVEARAEEKAQREADEAELDALVAELGGEQGGGPSDG